MKDNITRRHFLERASLAGAGLSLALPQIAGHRGTASAAEAIRKIQRYAGELARA